MSSLKPHDTLVQSRLIIRGRRAHESKVVKRQNRALSVERQMGLYKFWRRTVHTRIRKIDVDCPLGQLRVSDRPKNVEDITGDTISQGVLD